MTKLRTLKDLPNESRYDIDEKIKLNAVLIQDLREEAIKWIKDMREKNKIEELFSSTNELFYATEKFKEFFNITEEDLNGSKL